MKKYFSVLFYFRVFIRSDFIKTYIILDESGAMHLKNERYFIIGGYITKELHKVTSLHKRIEKEIKIKKNIDILKKVEFKSSKINIKQQLLFLNGIFSINTVIPIVIIIDKHNLKEFKASENLAYNYFVKTLLKYLFKCNISILNTNNIELRVDKRSVSVKSLKDLETFLQWEFDNDNLELTVKYLDSKDNRDIQMADYIANIYWKKYNKNITKIHINNYNKTFVSKFPIDKFGKNPSLKELSKNML